MTLPHEENEMGRLDGKVAVVTGGASGMGRATVELFLREGARVVVADLNEANGRALLERLARAGWPDRVDFIRVDVAEEPQVIAMLEHARGCFGRLDILFNNAGVGGAFGPITEISVTDWDFTQAVLLRSVFLGIKHGARMLIEQGQGGSILNTASIAGLRGGGGPQAYSAAKAGVVNLTQTTAVELAQHRVRVNAICPGVIVTPLMDRGKPERAAERAATLQPWPDAGAVEDIAHAALYLAADESRFVTGQTLTVDGGLMAAGPKLYGRYPGTSDHNPFVGVNRGSTGQDGWHRRLE
jgi:NAD(P)-dependent dehydrogenase (short-subunit alcohol dehydrogenase family)